MPAARSGNDVSWPRRRRAVRAALRRLHAVSRREAIFDDHGGHLILAFFLIASTSKSPTIQSDALAMGRERARAWRRRWPGIRRLDGDTIIREVVASYASERLGVGNAGITAELRSALAGYRTGDLLFFDPRTESAPDDIPVDCECGHQNARGRRRCRVCRRRVRARSRYEVFYYALAGAYFCERHQMPLGVRLLDVVRQTPRLRPYPAPDARDYYQALYAVTHLVYTLSDYGTSRLPRTWLRTEYHFLLTAMRWAIDIGEADTIGEVIDSLAILGAGDDEPALIEGRRFLLDTQQADGGWGDDDGDGYGLFHTLWTAIDGLRDYGWRGAALTDPSLRRAVRELAASPAAVRGVARDPYFCAAGAGTTPAGSGQLPSYGGQFGTARSGSG